MNNPQENRTPAAACPQTPEARRVLLLSAFAAAVLYTVCFTGWDIYPKLSFFVFCLGALGILYNALSRSELLKNKRAFLWGVPILFIAAQNAVFGGGAFTYINVIAAHIMFAALTFSAVKGARLNISDLSGAADIIRVILPSPSRAFRLIGRKRGCEHCSEIDCEGESHAEDTAAAPEIKGKQNKGLRILKGAALALPVFIIITAALMSADEVFNYYLQQLVDFDFLIEINLFGHIIAAAVAFIYFAGYIQKARQTPASTARFPMLSPDTVTGAAFLIPINLVFLVFCIIQTAFLFTGGFMTLPDGLVYSAYARQGFFQLLFVTVINFGVIIVFLKIFPSCIKDRVLRLLLIALLVFTGVLIASSYYRMSLYIGVYGYSELRQQVMTFLAFETALIILTFYYIFKPRFDFLRRYIYIGVVFYILVNITSSAYVVGRLNAARYYENPSAGIDITMFSQAETAGILLQLYESREFNTHADESDKRYVHTTLARLKQNARTDRWQKWQNFTVLGHAGRTAIARFECKGRECEICSL